MYCQREIESETPCAEQCDHCKEYYGPLEMGHAAGDYADSVHPDVTSNHYSTPEWQRTYEAFIAGCKYIKTQIKTSNYVDNDSEKIF